MLIRIQALPPDADLQVYLAAENERVAEQRSLDAALAPFDERW